jgi:hypothetical protein
LETTTRLPAKQTKRDFAPHLDHCEVLDWVAIGEADGIHVDSQEQIIQTKTKGITVETVNDGDFEEETDKTTNNEDSEEDGNPNTVPLNSLLEDVSHQQRECKVVKSDDAAVPKYLWEEHLTAGSKVLDWNFRAMHDLIAVSSWLRDRMLCWRK